MLNNDLTDYVKFVVTYVTKEFTAGQNVVNISTEVAAQVPAGYKRLTTFFIGAYPLGTWTNAYVTSCITNQGLTGFSLYAGSAQKYSLAFGSILIRDN